MSITNKQKFQKVMIKLIYCISYCFLFFLPCGSLLSSSTCGAKQHIEILDTEKSNKLMSETSSSEVIESTPVPTEEPETVGSQLIENTNNLVSLGTVLLCLLSFGVGVLVSLKFKIERKV